MPGRGARAELHFKAKQRKVRASLLHMPGPVLLPLPFLIALLSLANFWEVRRGGTCPESAFQKTRRPEDLRV